MEIAYGCWGILEKDWGTGVNGWRRRMAAELLGTGVGGFGVEEGEGAKYTNFPMVLELTTRPPVVYPSRTTPSP